MTVKQFLETVAPGVPLSGLSDAIHLTHINASAQLARPSIQLHCSQKECEGITWFDHQDGGLYFNNAWTFGGIKYVCRHCQKSLKWFALTAKLSGSTVSLMKIGEYPNFGPPLPNRLVVLVGSDAELFKRGFRSETDGLGMGAYVYYRRVVDNQRSRIFDEVIQAAVAVDAPAQQIKELEAAKLENKAIKDVKEAVPDSLLIGGQNPLTLLYKTLSEGIHEYSDAECLELAKDIRTVLTELAERISAVTENKDAVNSAVKRLLNRKR
jgi:hypothetical protein